MRLIEVFRGTPEEREAVTTVQRLSRKTVLNNRQSEILDSSEVISRRLFLRRAAGAGIGAVVAGSALIFVAQELLKPQDETFEGKYNDYLSGFESIAPLDDEATMLLTFLKERRKRGKMIGGNIIADENADLSKNFYTAIVDPQKNPSAFANMPGFSEFTTGNKILLLKNVPVSERFAGYLLGHESVHVYQWLQGIEQERQNGFLEGELDAYTLEFRLMDKTTKGKFFQTLKDNVEEQKLTNDSLVMAIGQSDLKQIDGLFPPALSADEADLRGAIYLLAQNFILFDLKNPTKEIATAQKLKYLDDIFAGKIPSLHP